MRWIFGVLLPLLFGGGSALYCAWELPQRMKDAERDLLEWRGLRLDRKGLIQTGILTLLAGTGLYLLGLFFYRDTVEYGLKLLFCFDLLAATGVVDAHTRIIPNRLVLAGLAGAAAFLVAEGLMGYSMDGLLWEALIGLAMGSGVFLLCALVTRGGIGMGDVKLFGVLGLLLGWTGVFDLIFLSVLMVAVYGIVLLLRRRLDRNSQVPIGPFALAGMAAMMLLGV